MTKMEMFEAIKTAVADNEEMVVFLNKEMEQLAKRNARKSTSLTKTQKENVEVKERIMDALEDEDAMTATEVANVLGISVAKASALLTQLVKAEKVERVKSGKSVTFAVR